MILRYLHGDFALPLSPVTPVDRHKTDGPMRMRACPVLAQHAPVGACWAWTVRLGYRLPVHACLKEIEFAKTDNSEGRIL